MVRLLKRQSKQQLLIFARKLPSLPKESYCEQINISCTEQLTVAVQITVVHIF